jgi:hypothetical protein
MARCTQYAFKLFGFAFGASELYLVFLVSYQKFKTIIAFQTPEFVNWHFVVPLPLDNLIV